MPTNRAAWHPAVKATALEVKDAPYTPASDDTIVIKTKAVAINPIDWLIQSRGDIAFTWLKYPVILGFDVAGEVVEVGKDVTRFQKGDRVLGLTRGTDAKVNSPAEGGFQEYTVLRPDLTSPIPSTMSYESAAVIPLGMATAATGLFQKDNLGLQLPTYPPRPSTGKTLLVWGGSTSVGCNAIQLAVAAGYEVFTTASPKNFEYVKKLGASQVFDYKSPTIIPNIISALKGKTTAGALSIGHGAAEACMAILDQSEGDKFVAMATYPVLQKEPQWFAMLRTVLFFASWMISYKLKGFVKGIKSRLVVISEEVVSKTCVDFLPQGLAAGAFVAAPESEVVGKGIESIQDALEYQKKGVSAKKVVVSL
jgi:NADPH:quinone reductase-like Zn-dependent oxidoreductase